MHIGKRVWPVPIAVAAACLSGCASDPPTPYPTTWPAVSKVTRCGELSGTYKNEAIATTLWKSPKLPETARAYLAYLLSDGTSGGMSKHQAGITSVRLDADKLTFEGVPVSDPDPSIKDPPGVWSCTPAGEINIQFKGRTWSEDSEGRLTIDVTLSKAADGALIAREQIHIVGVTWGIVPHTYDELDWMMFAPASEP